MFPTVVVTANGYLDKRPPLRSLGLPDEPQSSLGRRVIGFFGVTGDAGANDVFPSCWTAAILWNYMIQVKIMSFKNAPAVLAGILVSLKNVVPRELDFLFW